jgi:hypothetical protein
VAIGEGQCHTHDFFVASVKKNVPVATQKFETVFTRIVSSKKSCLNKNEISRSANQILVPFEQSRSAFDNPRDIFIFLPLCRTTIHEKSEALAAEKHINRLQYHTSCFQYRSSN